MSSAKFLDYEIALLLAKYGRAAVERALAHRFNLTVEELDSVLRTIPERDNARGGRKNASAREIAEPFARMYPEKATALRELAGRFENRRFLPELRDVRRFFEQRMRSPVSIKSRGKAAPRLFELLSTLSEAELQGLQQEELTDSYSSLGLIADHILGKSK